MKYVALIRGINVGGKSKLSMKELKISLENSDFEKVKTYINSGNILFESKKNIRQLNREFKKILKVKFDLDNPVLIINEKEFNKVSESIPSEWSNDKDMKCDVMFLWEKYHNQNISSLVQIKKDIDNIIQTDNAIIWSVDRKMVTKSGMLKVVGTDLYKNMTIRNSNTVRKISKLLSEI
jgi:uncharacterized protein (DUF1697 family)